MTHASKFLLVALLAFTAPSFAQGPPVDPDIQRAGQLIGQGKFDEAVTVLETILDRDPSEPWAWFNLGLAHHSAGRYDEALRGHMLALLPAAPRGQLRATASYNVACVHALQGRPEFALQWLHRARLAGFTNGSGLTSDSDLTSLCDDPRFATLSASMAIGAVNGARTSTLAPPRPGGTGGVTCAADGTLYVADFGANVWRIPPGGEPVLHATGFGKSTGSVLEPDGSLIQADFQNGKVWRIHPDGSKDDLGWQGAPGPVGITRDDDGTLFFVDFKRRAVMRARPGQQPEVIVAGGMLKGPNGICLAPDGSLYVCNYENGAVLRATQEGELTFVAELPGGGNGHLVWLDDALYVTSRAGNAVYRVTPAGNIALVVGSGAAGFADGAGASAVLALPNGITVGPEGKTLYVNTQLSPSQYRVRLVHLP